LGRKTWRQNWAYALGFAAGAGRIQHAQHEFDGAKLSLQTALKVLPEVNNVPRWRQPAIEAELADLTARAALCSAIGGPVAFARRPSRSRARDRAH